MIKLALIGKNIAHSRSPEIYLRLLDQELDYDLLDYPNEEAIPEALVLLEKYNGISITSPYKKHFLDHIHLTPNAKKLGAINCLRKDDFGIIGENTDFLAIEEILSRMETEYGKLKVIILGDGVMSKVTQMALEEKRIPYLVCSRKITNFFDQLDTVELLKNLASSHAGLVINTCAREFIFKGKIDKDVLFWDYNYNFLPHQQGLQDRVRLYMDGLEMLELQARFAIAFWSI